MKNRMTNLKTILEQRKFGLALVSTVMCMMASAGVFDDVSFWFDGAKSGDTGRTFATGDAIDLRHCATPSDAINQAQRCGSNPTVVTATVKRNYRGDTAEQQVLHFRQELKNKQFDETTQLLTNAYATTFQAIEFPDTMGIIEHQKPFSAIIRFKLDQSMLAEWAELAGKKSVSFRSTLLKIGLESCSHGLTLNLEYDNSTYTPGKYVIAERHGRFNRQVTALGTLETNKWYELAVSCRLGSSADKNYLRMALVKEGESITFANCEQNGTTPYWDPTQDEERRIVLASPRNDSWQKDEPVSEGQSWFRSFNGEISTVAFWNRSLSDTEIREAFGQRYPVSFPDVMRVGAADGTSGEFAGAAESATITDGNSQEWRNLPAQFSQENQSLTIKFKVSDDPDCMAGLGQMLTVKGASGSGSVLASIGEFSAVIPVSTTLAYAYVPGKNITTGEQTLTLKRLSGTFALDYVALGGSWQLGQNKSSAKTIGSGDMWQAKYHDYALATDDLTQFGSTIHRTNLNISKNTLHFNLSPVIAQSCPFKFTYYNHQVVENGMHTLVDVYINNQLFLHEWPIANNTSHTIKIPEGKFVAGENTLQISNLVYDAQYISVKTYILEARRPPTGMVIMLK